MHRLLAAVFALVLAAALVGCGAEEESGPQHAETEGIYLEQGELKYQVQMSRILNPADTEDEGYLRGLPKSVLPPDDEETWFGVFMRVENGSEDETLASARRFQIEDTDENVYTPVALDPKANPFAYAAVALAPGEVLPDVDSVAAQGVVGSGSLLLFKLPYSTLGARPLVFTITPPDGEGEVVTVDLDV